MKALFLSFFIACTIFLNAQPNYLDNSSQWHTYGWAASYNEHTFITTYLDGDTIINGLTYYKEYTFRKDSSTLFGVTISGPGITSYIRENSNQQFIRPDGFGNEWVVADFSLMIGDTLPLTGCPIFSIDTIYFGATPLKRYAEEFPPLQNIDNYYVEGIGKTAPFCEPGIDGYSYMVCYIKGNDTLQLNTAPFLCSSFLEPVRNNMPTNIVAPQDKSKLKIFPNPASDAIMIQHDFNHMVDVRIYDISGSERLHYDNVVSGQNLSIDKLAKGFYIVGHYSDNKLIGSTKLIKE